jgi:CheY-like chemotaxis protein
VAGKNISEIAEEERRHWTTAAKIVKEPDVAEYVKDVRARFFENDDRGYEVVTFPEPGLCPLHVVQECPCPAGTTCTDLIISDVNMSGTNGIDFVEGLIQKGCRQRHIAIMSGNFSEADLARTSRFGCTLFSKPLAMDALTAWVEEAERSIPAERKLYDWR